MTPAQRRLERLDQGGHRGHVCHVDCGRAPALPAPRAPRRPGCALAPPPGDRRPRSARSGRPCRLVSTRCRAPRSTQPPRHVQAQRPQAARHQVAPSADSVTAEASPSGGAPDEPRCAPAPAAEGELILRVRREELGHEGISISPVAALGIQVDEPAPGPGCSSAATRPRPHSAAWHGATSPLRRPGCRRLRVTTQSRGGHAPVP